VVARSSTEISAPPLSICRSVGRRSLKSAMECVALGDPITTQLDEIARHLPYHHRRGCASIPWAAG
jgi:hypothetical protein